MWEVRGKEECRGLLGEWWYLPFTKIQKTAGGAGCVRVWWGAWDDRSVVAMLKLMSHGQSLSKDVL